MTEVTPVTITYREACRQAIRDGDPGRPASAS